MIDNHFIIFMSATYSLAYPIVEHCQHCRSKNKGLDTFVFNDNSDNVRQYLIVCSIDDVACLIVDHCLYCRSKTTY